MEQEGQVESGKFITMKTVLLLAFCAGVVGGYTGFWVARWQSAASSDRAVIRASRIDLVGRGGKIFSTVAQDSEKGSAALRFYDENGNARATVGLQAAVRSAAGEWSKYAPSLEFFGNDGGPRLRLLVDTWDKPVMYMGAADWEQRIILGHGGISSEGPTGDSPIWELGFTTPGRTATTIIGTTEIGGTKHATSFVALNNQTHSLAIQPGGVHKLL